MKEEWKEVKITSQELHDITKTSRRIYISDSIESGEIFRLHSTQSNTWHYATAHNFPNFTLAQDTILLSPSLKMNIPERNTIKIQKYQPTTPIPIATSIAIQFPSTRDPDLQKLLLHTLQKYGTKLFPDLLVYVGVKVPIQWRRTTEIVQVMEIDQAKDTKDGKGNCPFWIKPTTQFVPFKQSKSTLSKETVNIFNDIQQLRLSILNQVQSQVGGLEHVAGKLVNIVVNGIFWNILDAEQPIKSRQPPRGVLLCGRSGSGKTALSNAACQAFSSSIGIATFRINGPDVFQKNVFQSEKYLTQFFNKARLAAPSIILFDEIESIASTKSSCLESRILSTFVRLLDETARQNDNVFVIGMTSNVANLHPSLFTPGRLEVAIDIPPPRVDGRLEILKGLTKKMQIEPNVIDPEDGTMDLLSSIAALTAGYVGADLLKLCREAALHCMKRNKISVNSKALRIEKEDFVAALEHVRPSVLQKSFQLEVPNVSLESLVGISAAIDTVRTCVLLPLQNYKVFKEMGISPPKGVLLYGVEGTGKTSLAQAIAKEAQGIANFLPVQCSEIISKVVGSTEQAIQTIFKTARDASPCILFFDQIECLAPPRGHDSSTERTFDRLLSTLLIEMDGASSNVLATPGELQGHVVVLASTTHKGMLDPAILRPGRFDHHIELTLPKEDNRAEILLKEFKRMPMEMDSPEAEALGIEDRSTLAAWLAKKTTNYSGAQLKNICRKMAMVCLRKDIASKAITIDDVLSATEYLSIE